MKENTVKLKKLLNFKLNVSSPQSVSRSLKYMKKYYKTLMLVASFQCFHFTNYQLCFNKCPIDSPNRDNISTLYLLPSPKFLKLYYFDIVKIYNIHILLDIN